ncbi:MAG TPA: phosphatidylserine decarboxylase family protein [Bacteroidales bacterium]|nr:phosphatidylserine decarboxylase family protein [Bacteroidales bacterium]
MKIHKEGIRILIVLLVILVLLNLLVFNLIKGRNIVVIGSLVVTSVFFLMVLWFFRSPLRQVILAPDIVYAPADGKVVVIEKKHESEYFEDERLQISIFMSPLNVHVNRYPVGGVIKYTQYHKGKYMVAWHPKSSDSNERSTAVIETLSNQLVMVKQIAGAVARRIVSYAKVGEPVEQGQELGFIKFGSRVDILLPVDAEILVNLEQKVVGNVTAIARLPEKNILLS